MSNTDVSARIARLENQFFLNPLTNDQGTGVTTLAAEMQRHHIPGVSIAVINDLAIEWARGYGVRENGSSDAVTPHTLFQACSISKPVTAVAALRLVQEGVLDLDSDVNDYLKSWRVLANDGWQPRVTLRQLLSHTAGLTVHGFPGYNYGEPLPTLRQVLDGEPPANTRPIRVNILPGTSIATRAAVTASCNNY